MAISFTPAEVDFLFPAPFHRRELLIYKLAKLLFGLGLHGLDLLDVDACSISTRGSRRSWASF